MPTSKARARLSPLLVGLFLVFFAVIAFAGGSARSDVGRYFLVPLTAFAVIAAALLGAGRTSADRRDPLLMLLGATAALIAVYAIPIPPGLWALMPGRDLYRTIAEASGTADAWRPIGLHPGRTIGALLFVLSGIAVALAARAIGPRLTFWLPLALLGLMAVDAVLTLLQWASPASDALWLYPITNRDSAVGLFANRNHNGALIAALMPMLGYALARGPMRVRHPFPLPVAIAIAMVTALCLLVVIGSRAGVFLGVVAAIATSAVLIAHARSALAGRQALVTVVAGGAAIIAIAIFLILTGRVASEELRTQLIDPLARIAWSLFPIGAGPGTFDVVYQVFEPRNSLAPSYLNRAHNDLIEITIEAGLPGLILLVATALWLLRTATTLFRAPQTDEVLLRLAALAGIAVLLIASLVDYPLRTALGFSTLIALAVLASPVPSGDGPTAHIGGWARAGIAVAAIVLMLLTAGRGILDNAVQKRPDLVLNVRPGHYWAATLVASQRLRAGKPREAAGLARRALESNLTSAATVRTLGLSYIAQGRAEEGRSLMRLASRLSRRDLGTQLYAIDEAVARGDTNDVLSAYDAVLRVHPEQHVMLFPPLIAATAEPSLIAPMARLLATRPGWHNNFLYAAADQSPHLEAVSDLIVQTMANGTRLEPRINRKLIARMIEERQFALANAHYIKVSDVAEAGPVRNNGFDHVPLLPPMDWGLTTSEATFAEISDSGPAGTGNSLYMSGPINSDAILARQPIFLRPGAYTLTASSARITADSQFPYITVVCVRVPSPELGKVVLDGRAAEWQQRSGSFVVPAEPGCAAQWLYIRMLADPSVSRVTGWVDEISITPAR